MQKLQKQKKEKEEDLTLKKITRKEEEHTWVKGATSSMETEMQKVEKTAAKRLEWKDRTMLRVILMSLKRLEWKDGGHYASKRNMEEDPWEKLNWVGDMLDFKYHIVIDDPLAALRAEETYLRNLREKMRKDPINNAHETSGVILVVRVLKFDSRLVDILNSPSGKEVHVLL
ncbi:hypothetical protein TSUD_299090 [Trifolium subterraneum]|nr:hypothetical protein TSUD_299090 [Trifolium subterraneum]